MSPDQLTGLGLSGPLESSKPCTGVLTLLFTDIVSSTALKQQLGDKAGAALIQQQRALVRQLLATCPGAEEIETAGDSFLRSFAKPSDAVRFALVLQSWLRSWNQSQAAPLLERIGIHLGEVVIEQHAAGPKPKDLYGTQLDTCARVMSLAKGGQVLMSRGVFDNARQVLKGEDIEGVGQLEWLNHGPYLLKGLVEPVEVCEVRETGQEQAPGPPTGSEKAQRQVRPDEEPVLGWRPAVGQVVPNTKWVLEKKLGEGGFGEVWLGRQQTTKEQRVFKFCFRGDRVRFLKRELTLFRVLKERVGDHPNIVRLHDVFLDQAPFYVEMDYVEGTDLRTWCEKHTAVEAIPLETRLEIIAQAADGLQAAHEAGIIHRDIKPANVLIGRKGTGPTEVHAKLTDFGIGQVVSEDCLKGITRGGFTQTMAGQSSSSGTGTQLYMAPELLAGKPASTRSDIYSLGVVLYQLLVGDFTRPVTTDWARQFSDSLLRDDLGRCFAGDPNERFGSAAELAKNLRALPERRADVVRRQAEQGERDRLQRQAEQRHKIVMVSASVTSLFLLLAIALGYGLRKAELARQLQRRYAYASDMKAAQVASQQHNRGMAVRLLHGYLPKSGEEDLRGLEWRYLWQESQSDELLSFRHPTMVETALLTPDDRHLATIDYGGTIRLWEVTSGRQVRESDPRGRSDDMLSKRLGCSVDGKWLAAESSNGVEIRDRTSLSVVRELKSAKAPLGFSPDGKSLATMGTDGLWLWDLSNWTHRVLTNAQSDRMNLAFTPDGMRVVCGLSRGGRLQLFDLRTGIESILSEMERGISSLDISPDGKWLACGKWTGEVSFWDLVSQRLVERFRAHRGNVFGLVFSPDSRWLATGGNDQMIHLWETGTTNKVGALQGHSYEIWSLGFSRDGQKLVSASGDGTAKLWGATSSRARSQVFALPTNAIPTGPLPDGSALVTLDSEQRLTQLWSLPSGHLLRSFAWSQFEEKGCDRYWHIPANAVVVGRTTNGTIHFWNLSTGAHLSSVQLGVTNLGLVCLSLDNHWLSGTSLERGLALYDLRIARRVQYFGDYARSGWRDTVVASFSPDGRWLAYGTTNDTVKIWDLAVNREKATLMGPLWRLDPIRFSPDSKLLAGGGWDGDVWLWSVDSGKPLFAGLKGHQSGLRYLVFSFDSRTLVSESDDGTIRWWSVLTGKEMLRSEDFRMIWYPATDLPSAVWDLGGKMLVWQQRQGPIQVTTLPTLAEIDAAEKRTESKKQ